MNRTLAYYNNHAAEFADRTEALPMTDKQERFEIRLRPGARILDFGCGSGRDSLHFRQQGFEVDAVDGSQAMCREAAKRTGLSVKQMLFSELDAQDIYDGIWASASLLHLSKAELPDVLRRMMRALKRNGIAYISFKYGSFEGERDGRSFTDLTEDTFRDLLAQSEVPELKIADEWVTEDARPDRRDTWLNVILQRKS